LEHWGERFPKARRLLKQRDFQLVLKAGRRIDSQNASIIFLQNELGFSRLGISVSKGIGHAADRNRIKRSIREAFRRNLALRSQSIDILFLVRSPGHAFSCAGIEEDIDRLVQVLR
jgi:ribonuclease P protein component